MVLPRPGDVSKWVIVPLCFLTTVLLVGGGSADSSYRALVVWIVLEFLLYQARYQWNDIRGFVADQRHPSSADRGRLPGPIHKVRSRVGVSAAVIALRLALAFAVAAALPTLQLWPWVIGLLVAVFGVAMVYEFLRSKATGYSDVVPSPLRPSLIALWVFVGAGYAVRGLTGLMLALPDPSAPAIPAAFVMLWAFGVSWVTARWALESLPFGRQVDGRIY